ncbi:hypothetical protein [Streptomyces sp. NPDC001642]
MVLALGGLVAVALWTIEKLADPVERCIAAWIDAYHRTRERLRQSGRNGS